MRRSISTERRSNLSAIMQRVQQRLDELGMTQSDLARRAGVHRDMISRLLLGKVSSPRGTTLLKIAEALNADVDWLAGRTNEYRPYVKAASRGNGTDAPVRSLSRIPVVGKVEAGAFRPVDEHIDEATVRRIDAAPHWRFKNFNHFAFDVVGDSMNLAGISDGDTIICIDWIESGMSELTGLTVVVERTINGGHLREWTVKEMEAFPDRVILHPRSSNPSHQPIVIERDHLADNGTEVKIIALVVNVLKNKFPF